MGAHPRFHRDDLAVFLTSRCRNSELWFANNPRLERAILGRLAVCVRRRKPKLYAFAIAGNHLHSTIHFVEQGQSDFLRDLNSAVAQAVYRFIPDCPRGALYARRASSEFVPNHPEDIEKQFFYTVLQPVQDGLVERISDYPWYNCFSDAVWGIEREFQVVDWAKYNSDKRWKKNISIKDYTRIEVLKYDRLPGYEDLSQKEYALLMHKKLEEYRLEVIQKRRAEGKHGFLGRAALLKVRPGSIPRTTKTSTRGSFRPRVLSKCPIRRQEILDWYFDLYFRYKWISKRYWAGEFTIKFPLGTHRPPVLCCGSG